MDGNRRFARENRIETVEGHNMGFETMEGHNMGFEALAKVAHASFSRVPPPRFLIDGREYIHVGSRSLLQIRRQGHNRLRLLHRKLQTPAAGGERVDGNYKDQTYAALPAR